MATFKGNIEFRGTDRTQGFKPIEIPDVTQQIRLNNEQYERTLARHEKATAQIREFSFKMQQDKDRQEAENRLGELAKWSETLTRGLQTGQQVFEENKKTEAKMALLDVAESAQELENLRLELFSLREDSDKIDEVKAKIAVKENVNMEAVARLNKLDNFQRFHIESQLAETIGKYAKPWLLQRLETDTETEIPLPDGRTIAPSEARTPEEKRAAMEVLLRTFHRETGASQLPDDQYRLSIKPHINDARTAILVAARKEHELFLSSGEQEKASQAFLSHRDLGKWVANIAATKDKNGYLGNARAWKAVRAQLKFWASNGQLTGKDIKAIFDQKSSRNPKVKWSDKSERYGLEQELLKLADKHDDEALELQNSGRDRKFKTMELQTMQEYRDRLAANDPFTEQELDDINKFTLLETNRPSEVVKTLKNGLSADDFVQDEQMKSLEALARTQQLHSNHPAFLAAHPNVQNAFMQAAQRGDKMMEAPGSLKSKFDLAKSWTKNHFKLTPFKSGHPQHDQVEAKMKELTLGYYNGKFKHVENETDRADLAWVAAQEEMARLNTIEGDRYYRDASKNYPNIDGDPIVLKEIEQAANQQITNINEAILGKGLSALPDAMDEVGQLEEIAKSLPTNGYKLPYKYHHFGARFGISPTELYNRARDAKGLGRITFPKAVTDLDRGLTPSQLRAIYKSPTPQGRAGAYCTATGAAQWQRPPLPDNIGEHLEVSAQQHAAGTGLTWQELAMLTFAVGDAENRGVWRNSGVSSAGARGYWQFIGSTARAMGVDPLNSQSATDGAIRHIASSMKTMAAEFPELSKEELMGLAALAYNAGDTAVISNRRNNPQYGGSFGGGENRTYLAHVLMAMCRFGGADIALHHPAMLNMSAFGDQSVEDFRSTYLTSKR
jgi:hypothetical protein